MERTSTAHVSGQVERMSRNLGITLRFYQGNGSVKHASRLVDVHGNHVIGYHALGCTKREAYTALYAANLALEYAATTKRPPAAVEQTLRGSLSELGSMIRNQHADGCMLGLEAADGTEFDACVVGCTVGDDDSIPDVEL